MKQPIEFKKDCIEYINDMAKINPLIRISKDGDKLNIIRLSVDQSIFAKMTMDIKGFEFVDDEISFIDFPDFYRFFKLFKEPNISQDNNALVIEENNSKIKYVLSHLDTVPSSSVRNIKFEDVIAEWEWDYSDILKIQKMAGMFKVDGVGITVKKDKLKVTVGDKLGNCFSEEYDIETGNPNINESYKFQLQTFTVLPKAAYNVAISGDGIIKFSLIDDNVDFDIYGMEVDE
jgi:hypothetical protein